MKKNLFLIAALVLGSTAVVGSSVSADSTDGKGTASLNIEAGAFTQTGAPSFSFTTTLNEALVTKGTGITSTGEKDASQTLEVADYVGADNGWNVTAQLGVMADTEVKVNSLDLAAATVKTDSDATASAATLTPAGAAAPVATATTGAGATTLSYADNSATLNLGKNTKIATTSADLTWTATQGKVSAAAFN